MNSKLIEKPPILITGCARSGTSLVSGIMHVCGAFKGDTSGPNRYNPNGMFENERIRNGIVKPYLRSIKCDPLGQYPLPDVKKLEIPVNLRTRVEKVMLQQGYDEGPWMYKGAKMCLVWPAWHYAFPNAKWIIVRRRSADIVTSCMNTRFMRAFNNQINQRRVGAKDEREGWLWWVRQHEKRFREMIENGLNVTIVWPERIVDGDYTRIKEAVEWAGLEWNQKAVTEFVEPRFWKAHEKAKKEKG
jgi:hypothetical protein